MFDSITAANEITILEKEISILKELLKEKNCFISDIENLDSDLISAKRELALLQTLSYKE